jgi:hypothetical protein
LYQRGGCRSGIGLERHPFFIRPQGFPQSSILARIAAWSSIRRAGYRASCEQYRNPRNPVNLRTSWQRYGKCTRILLGRRLVNFLAQWRCPMRALKTILIAAVLLGGASVCSARPWGYYPAYGAYYTPYVYGSYYTPYATAYGAYYTPYATPYYSAYRYPGYYSSYYAPGVSYGYAAPYSTYYAPAYTSYYYGW